VAGTAPGQPEPGQADPNASRRPCRFHLLLRPPVLHIERSGCTPRGLAKLRDRQSEVSQVHVGL